MPRSERRRWWLEPHNGAGWWGWMRMHKPPGNHLSDHATRYEVALWRLVQWQRIRLNRVLVECDIRAGMKRDDEAAWSRTRRAAVLASRCAEEAMRVELAHAATLIVYLSDEDDEDEETCEYPSCDECGERETCPERYHPQDDGIPF